MSKKVVKKNAWISWWEKDAAFRRQIIVTAAEVVSGHLHETREIRKIEAQAAADNALALRIAVSQLERRDVR